MENNYDYIEKAFLECVEPNLVNNIANPWRGEKISNNYYSISFNNKPIFSFQEGGFLTAYDYDYNENDVYFFLQDLIVKYFFKDYLTNKYKNIVEISINVDEHIRNAEHSEYLIESILSKECKFFMEKEKVDIDFLRRYEIKENNEVIKIVEVYQKC